jgi:glycosyltransferase involved in cell wall biosynthesis
LVLEVGVLVPLFPPAKNGGGPIRTLEALVSAAPPDFRVHVLTGDHDLGATVPLDVPRNTWVSVGESSVYYASSRSLRRRLDGFRALRGCRPAVLYVNGFFNPQFSILSQLLWRFGYWGRAIRLVAPRGEFGAGAFDRRTRKKRAYIALYRLLRLHKNVYWHASTEAEATDIRRVWGQDAAIVVRQNDTLLPARASAPEVAAPPRENGALRAVSLGRIAEHKGLHHALQALRDVVAPVELDVYGPEEDAAYAARCRAIVASLPSSVRVRFRGPVEPKDTRSTLSQYDVLVMPTAGENFGHVIAEALSVSVPVLCSPHTPWTDVLESGGGAAVPLMLDDWARAIGNFADLSPNERHAARLRAGAAYDDWSSRPAAPHVFEILRDRISAQSRVR